MGKLFELFHHRALGRNTKENAMGKIISMVGFWMAVLVFGPAWLTIVYLVVTMGALALIAKFFKAPFGAIVKNNNWVFFATAGMALASWFVSWLNPLEPQGPVNWLMRQLLSVPKVSGQGTFWGIVNTIFHGSPLTHGWTDAALLFAVCLIPAFIVSFWDEVKAAIVKTSNGDGHKGGIVRTLVTELWSSTVINKILGR